MRILTFSSLFPNPAQPNLGLFVAERLHHLLQSGQVEARIVAPVPWFPSTHPAFGKYAKFASVPAKSVWRGIEVHHPKYPIIPGPGWYLTPLSMALATHSACQAIRRNGFDFDLIDAHYYYPDGVAAAMLAQRLDRPLVVTARGTDVNLIPSFAIARRMILRAGAHAAASIAVSQALKDAMTGFGMDAGAITVLRNGVDLQRFLPLPRDSLRSALNLSGKVLLSAGYLIERKGHHIAIEAMRDLADWTLVIVGEGEHEQRLKQLASDCGVISRVRFIGAVAQAELVKYYNAADALVLASSREGMPNVVLEALACGTPVVATALWGTPEVVNTPTAGRLMSDRTPAAIVAAVRDLEASMPARAAVREHAEQFSWSATTVGLLKLLQSVIPTTATKKAVVGGVSL
jgi:glycosyltransferase involved in cell wall biosynthesis